MTDAHRLSSDPAAGVGTPLLEMRGISKRFPGVIALNDVSLRLHGAEVHVLVGENGAGKSTLMKVLSGAVRRDAGEILLDGRSIEIDSPLQSRRHGVSIIYQELNLVPHLSVGENIFLGKLPRRGPGLVDWARVNEVSAGLVSDLGLSIDPRTPVRRLGLAEQQMVEVAKALSDEARVLVMDEPTSALTAFEVRQLFAAIARLKAAGVAIVYISHRMEEIFEIGDRVTVLRDGANVATMPVAAAGVAELVRLMADRELGEQFPRREHVRGDEVLRVAHVSRRGALDDVSLVVHRGEIVGIAGLVGAGRTELARAIFGADPIDAGSVTIAGRPVVMRSPADAIANGVGFLPEDRKQHGLVLNLSIAHNVGLPNARRLSKAGIVRTGAERDLSERWRNALRIRTPDVGQRVVFLSGGNQQKVVLAKWLASEADLFIFDEPTRGIDLAARREIYGLIHDLAAKGAGILLISSELPEVLGMSDRVLVMRHGAICGDFAAGDATEAVVLNRALGIAS